MSASGHSAATNRSCVLSKKNTSTNAANQRIIRVTPSPVTENTTVSSASLNVQQGGSSKRNPGIPETYIEVLIVEPPEKQTPVLDQTHTASALYKAGARLQEHNCAEDVLQQSLANSNCNISDNHDSGIATSLMLENGQTFMLSGCVGASQTHKPVEGSVLSTAGRASPAAPGEPESLTIRLQDGQLYTVVSSTKVCRSTQFGIADSVLRSSEPATLQSAADGRQPVQNVIIKCLPSAGCASATTGPSTSIHLQRMPSHTQTTPHVKVSQPFSGISPLAASTPVSKRSPAARMSVKSSASQTPDSGISLSTVLTPSSTPLKSGVCLDSAATCSSWANSEDSNQLVVDLEDTGKADDDNPESQDGDSVLDTSLSSMNWLGTYALRPKPATQHQAVAHAQLLPPHISRWDPQHRYRLKFYDANEIQEMHKEYGVTRRPPYSYMNLIQMALSTKRPMSMKLKEICRWIEDHFPFYKLYAKPGWRNSIRHNLSLYPCFAKDEMSKKNGGYWTLRLDRIEPAEETLTRNLGDARHFDADGYRASGASLRVPLATLPQSSAVTNVCQRSLAQTDVKKTGLPVLLPRPAPTQAFVLVPVDQVPAPSMQSASHTPMVFIPSTVPAATSPACTPDVSTSVPKLPLPPQLIHTHVPKLPIPSQTKSMSVTASRKGSSFGKQRLAVTKVDPTRKGLRTARARQKISDGRGEELVGEEPQNLLQQAWLQANRDCVESECETSGMQDEVLDCASAPQNCFHAGGFTSTEGSQAWLQVSESPTAAQGGGVVENALPSAAVGSDCVQDAASFPPDRQVSVDRLDRNSDTDTVRSASMPPILTKRVKCDNTGPSQSCAPVGLGQTGVSEVEEIQQRARGRRRRKQVYPKQKSDTLVDSGEAEIMITCAPAAQVSGSSGQLRIESAHFSQPLTVSVQAHHSDGKTQHFEPGLCQELKVMTASQVQGSAALQASPAANSTAPHTSTPIRGSSARVDHLPSPISGLTPQQMSPCTLNNSFLENLDEIFVSPPSCPKRKSVAARTSPSNGVLHHHGRYMASLSQHASATGGGSTLPELKTPPSLSLQKVGEGRQRTPKYSLGEKNLAASNTSGTTSRKSLEFQLGDVDLRLLEDMDIPSFSLSASFNPSPPFDSQANLQGVRPQHTDGDHNLMHFVFDTPLSSAQVVSSASKHSQLDSRSHVHHVQRSVSAATTSSVSAVHFSESEPHDKEGVYHFLSSEAQKPMSEGSHHHVQSQGGRDSAHNQVCRISQQRQAQAQLADARCMLFTQHKENLGHYQDCHTPATSQAAQSDVSRMLFPQPHSSEPAPPTTYLQNEQQNTENSFQNLLDSWQPAEQRSFSNSYSWGQHELNPDQIAGVEAKPKLRAHDLRSVANQNAGMTCQNAGSSSKLPNFLRGPSDPTGVPQEQFLISGDSFQSHFLAHGHIPQAADDPHSHSDQCLFDSLFQS